MALIMPMCHPGMQDAEEDVEAAQQHLQAAEAHAREAADLVAGMGDSEAVSAEYAEGIAQNEAAASAAVTEAQQQVLLPAQWHGAADFRDAR